MGEERRNWRAVPWDFRERRKEEGEKEFEVSGRERDLCGAIS